MMPKSEAVSVSLAPASAERSPISIRESRTTSFVEAGTLLVALDPRDYQAELEHASANLNTRIAEARSAQITVPIEDASAFGQLHAAEAAKAKALASVKTEQANLAAARH